MPEKIERDHYSFTGKNAKESPDGSVSGHTGSPETEATQEEMRGRGALLDTLRSMEGKYAQYEDIARAFEDASGLTSPREQAEAVKKGLNDILDGLEGRTDVDSASKRRRITIILDTLDESL